MDISVMFFMVVLVALILFTILKLAKSADDKMKGGLTTYSTLPPHEQQNTITVDGVEYLVFNLENARNIFKEFVTLVNTSLQKAEFLSYNGLAFRLRLLENHSEISKYPHLHLLGSDYYFEDSNRIVLDIEFFNSRRGLKLQIGVFDRYGYKPPVYACIDDYKSIPENKEYKNTIERLEMCFIDQEKFNFLQDFIKNAILYTRCTTMVKQKLSEVINTEESIDGNNIGWLSVNNGEYFIEVLERHHHVMYKYNDNWSSLCWDNEEDAEEIVKILNTSTSIELCESPKKTHWKYFLHLEMLEKQKREKECHDFIDHILNKQREFNDLQYQYNMMPSAPIKDVDSFINFCKMVEEDEYTKYHDYEIQNYLLLKGANIKD